MATRALIGYLNDDNTITTIKCENYKCYFQMIEEL